MSKQLVRVCLLYNFNVDLSAAASSHQIFLAFGDDAASERTASHWFQKFGLEELSLCGESRSGQTQVLDYKALKVAM